jgi:hypothetical protein
VERSTQILLAALAAGGVAAGWTVHRSKARRKLEARLIASPEVQSALMAGAVTWTPQDRAAGLISPFTTVSVDTAHVEVIEEVRRKMPAESLVDRSEDAWRATKQQLEGLGYSPEEIEEARASAEQAAKEAYDYVSETAGGLYDYIFGSPDEEEA